MSTPNLNSLYEPSKVLIHFNTALALYEQGKYESYASYKKAIAIDPNYKGAYNNMSSALLYDLL